MPFTSTALSGVYIFEPLIFRDDRGFFFESFNEKVFQQGKIHARFIQDNQSFSKASVIRGLHYQLEPHAQAKLVRVLDGRILDVAVDIRKGSPSFGQWIAVELSSENNKQLFIPKGFAHGFSVLSETASVLYKCDNFYHKESEGGIIFNDKQLNIDWKTEANHASLSAKDLELPDFENARNNFEFRTQE